MYRKFDPHRPTSPTLAKTHKDGLPKSFFRLQGSATLYDGVGSVKRHVDYSRRKGSFFLSYLKESFLFLAFRPRLARESGGGFWSHQPSIRPLTSDHDSFFRRRDR